MDEQTGNMDYDGSGNFSGIVDCDVVIFGGRQFLFILSISAKIKYGALCEVIYRDQFCTVGLELPEIVPDRGGHSACFNFFGSLCFCAVALYRKKIRTDVAAGTAGISEQYGSCGILYSDISIRSC